MKVAAMLTLRIGTVPRRNMLNVNDLRDRLILTIQPELCLGINGEDTLRIPLSFATDYSKWRR